MVFDLVDVALEDVDFECDKCGHHFDILHNITLEESNPDSEYHVCGSCQSELSDSIEDNFWYDIISEEDYERLISHLESVEEILCVYDDGYTAGDVTVHTKYCTTEVVEDACEHFGYQIRGFNAVTEEESSEPACFAEHGEVIEIHLVPDGDIKPLPISIEERNYSALDYVDESDKIFD